MSTLTFTIYDSNTGRILGACTMPAGELAPTFGDIAYYGGLADQATEYIDTVTELPIARPAWPSPPDKTTVAADGAELVTFSNVPAGTRVHIKGPANDDFTVDDGTVELTFDLEGSYDIWMISHPYLDYRGTIDAT